MAKDLYSFKGSKENLLAYAFPSDYTDPKVFDEDEKMEWRRGRRIKNWMGLLKDSDIPGLSKIAERAIEEWKKKGYDIEYLNDPVAEEYFRRLFYRAYTEHQKDPTSGWTPRKAIAAFQDTPHALWNTAGLPLSLLISAAAGTGASGMARLHEKRANYLREQAAELRKKAELPEEVKKRAKGIKSPKAMALAKDSFLEEASKLEAEASVWEKDAASYRTASEPNDLYANKTAGEIQEALDEAMNDWTNPERLAAFEVGTKLGGAIGGPGGALLGAVGAGFVDPFIGYAGRETDVDTRRSEGFNLKKLGIEGFVNAGMGLLGEGLFFKPKIRTPHGSRVSVSERNRQIAAENKEIRKANKAAQKEYEQAVKERNAEVERLTQDYDAQKAATEEINRMRFDDYVDAMERYREGQQEARDLFSQIKSETNAKAREELELRLRAVEAQNAENERLIQSFEQAKGSWDWRKANLDERQQNFFRELEEQNFHNFGGIADNLNLRMVPVNTSDILSPVQKAENRLRETLSGEMKFLPLMEEELTPNINAKWFRQWAETNPTNPRVVAMAEAEENFLKTQSVLAQKQAEFEKARNYVLEQIEKKGMTESKAASMLRDLWENGATLKDFKNGAAKIDQLSFSELAKLGKEQYQQLAPFKEGLKGLDRETLESVGKDYPLFGPEMDWGAHNKGLTLADFKSGNFGLTDVEKRILNDNPVDSWWNTQHIIRKGRVGNVHNYSLHGMPTVKNSMQNTAGLYGGEELRQDIGHQLARERGYGETRSRWNDAVEMLNTRPDELAELLLKDRAAYNDLYRLEAYNPEGFPTLKKDIDRWLTAYGIEKNKPLPMHMTRQMDMTAPEVPFPQMTSETRMAYNPSGKGPDFGYDFDPARFDIEGRPLSETALGSDVEGFNLAKDVQAFGKEAEPVRPQIKEPVPVDEDAYWAQVNKGLEKDWETIQSMSPTRPETPKMMEMPKEPKLPAEPKKPVPKKEKPELKYGSKEVREGTKDFKKDVLRAGYYGYVVPTARELAREAKFWEGEYDSLIPGNTIAEQDATRTIPDSDPAIGALSQKEHDALERVGLGEKKTEPKRAKNDEGFSQKELEALERAGL